MCVLIRTGKFIYGIEAWNDMTNKHDKKVNNIAEWNLLHDIKNPYNLTK